MTCRPKSFALGIAVFAASWLSAAESKAPSFLPAISIQPVNAPDVAAFALLVDRCNEAMKTQHGVAPFLRFYVGETVGESAENAFVLSPAGSFATLLKHARMWQDSSAFSELRRALESRTPVESRILLKAVRFDGTHQPGWLYNTLAVVSDERGHLEAISQLRSLLDEHALQDARINIFRVIAGQTTSTHLISINTPSEERLATLLDAIATAPWAADWRERAARSHTIVRNAVYREQTR